jgi:hypothetical protein
MSTRPSSGRDKKILIEIIEFYKGKISDTKVVIITEFDNGICGIDPQINETWLMYSFERGGFNYTDLCTKSKIIKSAHVEDKYQMKELKRELKILEKNKKSIYATANIEQAPRRGMNGW